MLAAALIVAAIIYGECGDSDIDGGGLSTDQGGRKRGPVIATSDHQVSTMFGKLSLAI
jgi:hypothetical protein